MSTLSCKSTPWLVDDVYLSAFVEFVYPDPGLVKVRTGISTTFNRLFGSANAVEHGFGSSMSAVKCCCMFPGIRVTQFWCSRKSSNNTGGFTNSQRTISPDDERLGPVQLNFVSLFVHTEGRV